MVKFLLNLCLGTILWASSLRCVLLKEDMVMCVYCTGFYLFICSGGSPRRPKCLLTNSPACNNTAHFWNIVLFSGARWWSGSVNQAILSNKLNINFICMTALEFDMISFFKPFDTNLSKPYRLPYQFYLILVSKQN